MTIFLKILFLLLAYLIGAIPFGLIICKIKGIDVRAVGSGNIGASNVRRATNLFYSMLTFSLDMVKGALFVVLFRYEIIPSTYMVLDPALYGVIAMIGHAYPIFLKFKGGKSVATGAGFIFSYLPLSIIVGVISFGIILKLSNMASVGSLGSSLFVVITAIVFTIIGIDPITNVPIKFYFAIGAVIALIIVYIRHIPNIKRLINKQELKANEKAQ